MNMDKQAKDTIDKAARDLLAAVAARLMTDVAEDKVRELLQTVIADEVARQLKLPQPIHRLKDQRAELAAMREALTESLAAWERRVEEKHRQDPDWPGYGHASARIAELRAKFLGGTKT